MELRADEVNFPVAEALPRADLKSGCCCEAEWADGGRAD